MYTHLANGPWKKSLNFIFPTKYVIPKSLKLSHWLSEYIYICYIAFNLKVDTCNIQHVSHWEGWCYGENLHRLPKKKIAKSNRNEIRTQDAEQDMKIINAQLGPIIISSIQLQPVLNISAKRQRTIEMHCFKASGLLVRFRTTGSHICFCCCTVVYRNHFLLVYVQCPSLPGVPLEKGNNSVLKCL